MNNRQLRGFIRIVECGSFTAAADELYITQSALSQQMKLLEQDLGFTLFNRSTHKASLTDAGHAFYARAEQLLLLYERAVDEGKYLERSEKEHRSSLIIGCLDEQVLSIWTEIIRDTQEWWPNYSPMWARYDSRPELIRALLSGECQLSIQPESQHYDEAGLLFLPFTSIHEVALFSTPDLFDKPTCKVEDLADKTVIFHNKRGYCLFEDALRRHLAVAFPSTGVLNPPDFSHPDNRGYNTVLLIPSILLPESAARYAVSLEWGDNIRLGVVLPPSPSDVAQQLASDIQKHFSGQPSLWR